MAELWPGIVIRHKTSVIRRLATRSSTASEAVDTEEAGCRQHRQDTGSDGDPEAPAEVRVMLTRRDRSTVRTARETTERRHRRRLHDNCHKHTITYTGTGVFRRDGLRPISPL